jgi:hypothetical protein
MQRTTHKQHLLAVLLLSSAVVFQSVGWLMTWSVLWNQVHHTHQTRAGHKNAPLETLVISRQTFTESRIDKHEIRINNKLYDIEYQEFIGDSVRLVVYYDHEEQHLLETLATTITGASDNASGQSSPVVIWLVKCFCATFIVPAPPALPYRTKPLPDHPVFAYRVIKAQFSPFVLGPPPR